MGVMNNMPGIFNDVIGPVMRGPSSSHTAASWRIARVCLDILNEPLKKAVIAFDEKGAWAANYVEQGTVIVATRDFRPPDFVEILQKHISSDAEKLVPNPVVGGWGKFIRTDIRTRRSIPRRRSPSKRAPNKSRQIKKNGRGWLHLSMK